MEIDKITKEEKLIEDDIDNFRVVSKSKQDNMSFRVDFYSENGRIKVN